MNIKQKLQRMESRLQSNEVRIPKSLNSSLSTYPIPIKNNHNQKFGEILNISSTSSSTNFPDFDLNGPCQFFKSSFARSLSLGNNETKSLDFGINFALNSRRSSSPITEEQPQTLTNNNNDDFLQIQQQQQQLSSIPPLPLSKPPQPQSSSSSSQQQWNNGSIASSSNCSSSNNSSICSNSGCCNTAASCSSSSTNCERSDSHTATVVGNRNNGGGGNHNKNVWSTSQKQNFNRRSLDSTEIEAMRLRKECQNLVEENRRLMNIASGIVDGQLIVPGNSPNIEAVILQTQVDTLQWQLKQVEGSREMYRAVMEEVVRFLERCHRNLDSLQQHNNEHIIRSKSTHHVNRTPYDNSQNLECQQSTTNLIGKNGNNSSNGGNVISSRARSSTNLIDVHKNYTKLTSTKSNETDFSQNSPAISSYNNFRDFTWRRSPKRGGTQSNLSSIDSDPEKLSQEAFRLLRTAQNLLNTQEPDLAQSKINTDPVNTFNSTPAVHLQSSTKVPTTTTTTKKPSSSSSSKTLSSTATTTVSITAQSLNSISTCNLDVDPFATMTFSRKINMRESRLSLRSSTDSSVHSTSSSSKNETDEENMAPPAIINLNQKNSSNKKNNNKDTTIFSSTTTEDESGFSSISSFQEIGLPLHSTMIGSNSISCSSSNSSSSSSRSGGGDSTNINGGQLLLHNSTLISNDSTDQQIANTICMESRNSTLKASQTSLTTTNGFMPTTTATTTALGLPTVNHRRWDSVPIVPPRANFHRFSTVSSNGDDGPAVLWV